MICTIECQTFPITATLYVRVTAAEDTDTVSGSSHDHHLTMTVASWTWVEEKFVLTSGTWSSPVPSLIGQVVKKKMTREILQLGADLNENSCGSAVLN